MRKLIFLAIVFATVITTSCNKDEIEDFTIPVNLSGTTWKYTANDQWLEYALLIFTSTTTVEGWDKRNGEAEVINWTGSFTISNDTISVEGGIFSGIIDGETIASTNDDTIIFFKQ
ncbi:MAG: hypothetical protein OEW67_04060 [Cyclobacteriaceae bacterium]|nr:hypothetical protein [Cyclobacteriaceae bacterium]